MTSLVEIRDDVVLLQNNEARVLRGFIVSGVQIYVMVCERHFVSGRDACCMYVLLTLKSRCEDDASLQRRDPLHTLNFSLLGIVPTTSDALSTNSDSFRTCRL